jgi:glutathione S-transferase
VWKSCQRVEDRLAQTGDGYLVGGRFTAADLTAASLLGPALGPPGSPWHESATEAPMSAELMAFREEFRKRAVAPWMTEIWQKHRRPARS